MVSVSQSYTVLPWPTNSDTRYAAGTATAMRVPTAASHPGVLECAAIGVPDEHSGEAVKVFVVKKDPSLTEAQVQQWCKDKLTGYKRPRFVEFRDELPKSNVGKILRRELRPGAEAAAPQGQAA